MTQLECALGLLNGFLVVANYGKTPRELYVTMREENASDVLASRRIAGEVGSGDWFRRSGVGRYCATGDGRRYRPIENGCSDEGEF